MSSKARAGDQHTGGRILRVLKPKGASRATRVKVCCSHCQKVYTCRYTRLAFDRQKSCGCYGRSLFKKHYQRIADRVPLDRALVIAESAVMLGQAAAAKKHGLSTYEVSFIARRGISEAEAIVPQERWAIVFDGGGRG